MEPHNWRGGRFSGPLPQGQRRLPPGSAPHGPSGLPSFNNRCSAAMAPPSSSEASGEKWCRVCTLVGGVASCLAPLMALHPSAPLLHSSLLWTTQAPMPCAWRYLRQRLICKGAGACGLTSLVGAMDVKPLTPVCVHAGVRDGFCRPSYLPGSADRRSRLRQPGK